ncbi:MAG: PEGA domain-containing protein [Candidatus Chisholmbacteria bacterium]|nr:PEGA domain-containing protein [Candidatus Chisholmbacteria bacterium]
MQKPLKTLLFSLLSLGLIAGGTYIAIKFGQGYRPSLENRTIQGTGLLVVNSFPSAAQVFLNGKLTTATDDTLNLPPGDYEIEIRKDGFTPWKKTLKLKAELVTQTNTTLFPSVPTLKPLTFTGAQNATPSPDGQKIAFVVKNAANAARNGLWVLSMTGGNFLRDVGPNQVMRDRVGLDTAAITWSPDSRQLLIHTETSNWLVDATRLSDDGQLTDVTARLPVIFSEWELELTQKELQRLLTLPDALQTIILKQAKNVFFSPDEKKLLYTATEPVTIPTDLLPPLPSESTQPEERSLEPGARYVYDLKEDKNFRVLDPHPAELGEPELEKTQLIDALTPETSMLLPDLSSSTESASPASNASRSDAGRPAGGSSSPLEFRKLQEGRDTAETIAAFNAQYSSRSIQNIQWFPTSSHLIITSENSISIIEYDGTNLATIFANSFAENFSYPWPDGSELVTLTNLSATATLPPNLYTINLK